MAAAGWLGLFVPVELGGSGATALEGAVVFEELGRGPVPGPILASSMVSALILTHLHPSSARDSLLTGIADGTAVVIPAFREPETAWDGVAASTVRPDATGTLTCTKLFVPYADAATHFLVSTRGQSDGETSFCIVEAASPSVSVRKLGGFILANYEVRFADAALVGRSAAQRPLYAALDEALAPGLVALAAYQAGGSAAVYKCRFLIPILESSSAVPSAGSAGSRITSSGFSTRQTSLAGRRTKRHGPSTQGVTTLPRKLI